MGKLGKLAGDTAIYGLGTMLPRLLNYGVLTPYYTRIFSKAEYGIITELYAYVVVLQVILTYGLETGYFRFSVDKDKSDKLYSTLLVSLFVTSVLFVMISFFLSSSTARLLEYEDNVRFIRWFSLIVAIDAFSSLPFARLRRENRPIRFSIIKITNVIVTIALVVFFYSVLPTLNHDSKIFITLYDENMSVGYVFIANLFASCLTIILLGKEITFLSLSFNWKLLKQVLFYSLPLLIAGLAGILNEALDRILLKHLLPDKATAMEQLGVYGANFKLAVFMTLFVQMFRYAAEPFFFANMNNTDARQLYAKVMNFFVMFCSFIYLGIVLNIDLAKYFIGREFHEGLFIVPVVLMANLLLGVYYNLSIWYKLNNKTIYGAWFMLIGVMITIMVNIIYVPVYGIAAAAWCHLIVYGVLVILSYLVGQRQYAIPYNVTKILYFIFLPVLITLVFAYLPLKRPLERIVAGNIIFVGFVLYTLWREGLTKQFVLYFRKH